MLHAEQQHLKFSFPCLHSYLSYLRSRQLRSVTATFLLVQSHQLYTPLSNTPADAYLTLHWPCCPLSTSLLVSVSPTHAHFERSSPSPDPLLWCNPIKPELANNTANPTTLENRSRAPVPEGSSLSSQKYGTFDINWDKKGFKTALRGGKQNQIKCWDKSN